MKTTTLLTVALLACGSIAFATGCDQQPTDAPKPTPNTGSGATPAEPSMTPPPATPATPSTGPSAADTTNTPSMGSGGIAPATPPAVPATPSTQPGKAQSSTGSGSGKESLVGKGLDTGSVGASVPIDTDAGIAPPTREEKTGRP
jgi:hypothetical protein